MPSSIDAGIAHVRDTVMPELEGMEGYVGLSLLADRTSGRCIITTAWDSEETMRSSAEAVQEVRRRAAEAFGGGSPTVDEWEIAVLHRDRETGEGAGVRVTWAHVDPDQIDSGIEVFKAALPAMQELEGHCSASLLVDRASGRGVSTVAYESADAMERNHAEMDRLKGSVTDEAAAQILDEHDFELMIAHLRVPEMA
jgi:heme-degrading monooxygenase HmoA